ncbi:MAG TPA: Mu-like prophage major head subunit gpT family protein, partial [Myxococcota bacterium]|nr:Mu-like prophage major head subunit gpT family protein [Myxococcota bacterium]
FRAMGAAARLHPDKLVCDLLNDGFTEKCYDGKAFFATDHPMQSGTQSNKTQKKLSAAEFEIGVAALRKMKNFQGELQSALSLGGKLALIVPPALESTADAIVTAAVKTGGATNTNFGKAEKIVWDRLTSETAWFLAVVDGPVSPLIYQVRKDPELVMLANPDDESVFTRREIVHGVDGRWAATYGPFQLCYGSDGTVA